MERLKARVERDKLEHAETLQTKLATISVEMDRLRKTYELHVKKEYELYELVYPQVLKAYDAFSRTKGIEEVSSFLEEIDGSGNRRSPDQIERMRRTDLESALNHLDFIDEIRKRKPFIHQEVYAEIEKFWEMGYDTWFAKCYPALNKPPFTDLKKEYSDEELMRQVDAICGAIKKRLRVIDA